MCGNRVEELETRVQELEASVEGLTDELVECKVRLRELEDVVDADGEDSTDDSGPVVAASGGAAPGADTSKSEDTKTDDNREESEADSGSDIIVA